VAATATKKKPVVAKLAAKVKEAVMPKPAPKTEERPVARPESPRQNEKSFLAFTIQRKHDGVTYLYELVLVRVETRDGVTTTTEVRRDPGTTREIVESKIFRDLSEIVF